MKKKYYTKKNSYKNDCKDATSYNNFSAECFIFSLLFSKKKKNNFFYPSTMYFSKFYTVKISCYSFIETFA